MGIYAHEIPGENASSAAILEPIFGKDTKSKRAGSSQVGKCVGNEAFPISAQEPDIVARGSCSGLLRCFIGF